MVTCAAAADAEDAASRRLCVINSRGHDGHGLGFSLHYRAGQHGSCAAHIIGGVVAGSPAADAGLRDGDRVLEVNGVSVDRLGGHDDVAAMIKSNPDTVALLVLHHDRDDDERSTQNEVTVAGDTQPRTEPITGSETEPEGLGSNFPIFNVTVILFFDKISRCRQPPV